MKSNPKIAIIDYGVGNLHSLLKAVQNFTANVKVTDDPEEIASSDALILPGVGAFQAGMEGLAVRGLVDTVKNAAKSGKPILGICLGAQILLEKGYEFGQHIGLGLIPGKVVKFEKLAEEEKIPQVGWNRIYPRSESTLWENTILAGLEKRNPHTYFVHSYIMVPDDDKDTLAKASYGGEDFCAAVKKGNITGTQFHPEKSGEVGLAIIKNFVDSI